MGLDYQYESRRTGTVHDSPPGFQPSGSKPLPDLLPLLFVNHVELDARDFSLRGANPKPLALPDLFYPYY